MLSLAPERPYYDAGRHDMWDYLMKHQGLAGGMMAVVALAAFLVTAGTLYRGTLYRG